MAADLQTGGVLLDELCFSRAKRERRRQRLEPPGAEAARGERPPRIAPLVKLVLAALAVVALFLALRIAAPLPWSYDEYYHLGLARELRADWRMTSLRWTPFSLLYDHFADKEPLFHLLLLPLSGLPLVTAATLGVALGLGFAVGAFAWAMWMLRVPRPWWFVAALAALGPLPAQRLEMCRPHVWLIGFAVLAMALLVERRWIALAVVSALFGLAHTGGWISIAMAGVWLGAARLVRDEAEPRPWPWQALAATAGGWLAGQLLHPQLPANFALFVAQNFVVPFQSTAAGDAALRSVIGTELSPPGLTLWLQQWPALVVAVLVAVGLAAELRSPARQRSRAVLTASAFALAFVVAGSLLIRRFLEIGAPLALLALALQIRERGAHGPAPERGGSRRLWAALGIALGAAWTVMVLVAFGFGLASPPLAMARFMAANGKPGERVFTAQWADSAPLLYFAPQLQSLVALDPTFFYLHDRQRFAEYVDIIEGRRSDPARDIRQRFGARWVTIWRVPVFQRLAIQLRDSPGVKIVFNDRDYVVMDLGPG